MEMNVELRHTFCTHLATSTTLTAEHMASTQPAHAFNPVGASRSVTVHLIQGIVRARFILEYFLNTVRSCD